MRSILSLCGTIALNAILSASVAQTAQIIYVNKAATGAANGTSWANAYPELRTALTAASSITGTKEIWVARGEYKPTSDLNRNLSFVVPTQTFLYGGFIGNEASKEARNWKTNRTVLSGDLGKQFDKGDNSYNVVLFKDVDQSAGIDGFIITEGNATGTPSPFGNGGGICIWASTSLTAPRVNNCVVVNNHAAIGGGIAVNGNAGIVNSPEIKNTTVNGNSAFSFGGGMYIGESANNHTTCINSSFSSNVSQVSVAGAILNQGASVFINCTITYNRSANGSPAIFSDFPFTLQNSIIWKNFSGSFENPNYNDQIVDEPATSAITNNIIQGGYGSEAANNLNTDPLFEKDPSFVGKYPRTSIIPVGTTEAKYENKLEFNGPILPGPWPYYAYKDHTYNKIYLQGGWYLQVLDFSNLVNNKPTSTIYYETWFPLMSRTNQAIHNASNKIYFTTFQTGMISIDRATGVLNSQNLMAGEPVSYTVNGGEDVVVDNTNNLLYAPVFYNPGAQFYGLLELNLTTQTKRWITNTSSPVNISVPVAQRDHDNYWGGFRIHLDEQENVLYFSTGNGVWWWNRNTNATGVISTQGGIQLAPGSQALPSNKTTGILMDHSENKLYVGTHAGLYVWNRTNNTTRIYNTQNSRLKHNLINHIDINTEKHLVYVACEDGGLFVINTVTGEEKAIFEDSGSEVFPQYMDNSAASAYYDAVDNKLYVSADHSSGGVWIQDYNNLIPDYGDLRLKAGSPAIDRGNTGYLPSSVTLDINGLTRLVDYATLFGANSLDLGAYEKIFNEEEQPAPAISDDLALNYILSYDLVKQGITEEETLDNYPVRDVNKSIQYLDGLGRPVQSIQIQASSTRHDIIQPITYDEFGREKRKYLPFVSGNSGDYRPTSEIVNVQGDYIGPAQTFYDGGANGTIADDTRPFSEIMFEASPLNRALSTYGPGQAWAPTNAGGADKPITYQYFSNVHALTGTSSAEAIYAFKVNASGGLEVEDPASGYVEQGGHYSSNQLSIKTTKDEHGNAVREYTNKQGQVILKKVQALAGATDLNNLDAWACTYYVYDDLGNLRFVLQPEGFKIVHQLLNQN